MKTNIRKQFSKAYQVFEIQVEDIPKEYMEATLNKMDVIGKEQIENMVKAVGGDVTAPTETKTYSKPAYNNNKQYTNRGNSNGGYSPKLASPKQIEYLNKHNIQFDPNTITAKEASQLLEDAFAKADANKGSNKPTAPSVNTQVDPYEDMGKNLDNIPF